MNHSNTSNTRRPLTLTLLAAVVGVLAVACGDAPGDVNPCLEQDAAITTDRFGDEDEGAVQMQCEDDGGQHCDSATYLARQTAVCLAEAHGLADGLADWDARLIYNFALREPIWTVSNTIYQNGPADEGGEYRTLGATTGLLLEEGGWGSTP